LFATSSIETIVDASGTYSVLPPAVNHPPVVQNVLLSATEDGLTVTGAFAGDDSDADDNPTTLHYTITSQPIEGSVVNNNDGTFSFSPVSGFQDLAEGAMRQVAFTYTATDSHGAVSNTGTVSVTVTGVNDAPVITSGPQSSSVSEGDGQPASAKSATGQVTFTDVDSSDSHTLSVSVAAAHGTASIDPDGTWHYTVSDSGAVDALAAGEHLADSFTVRVDDHNGGIAAQT
ncbi:Ig-like domain-containing protein, partial [Mesorhizobium sp.]